MALLFYLQFKAGIPAAALHRHSDLCATHNGNPHGLSQMDWLVPHARH